MFFAEVDESTTLPEKKGIAYSYIYIYIHINISISQEKIRASKFY